MNLHSSDREDDYNFCDSLHPMIVAIRTKDVGIIVALQDAGIISDSYGRYVQEVAGRKLLPIQFEELYARCLYQLLLFTRTPKFFTTISEDINVPTSVHMLPIGGLSSIPIVEEWVQADYAEVLAFVMQKHYPEISTNQLFVPPNQVMSWMTDSEGKLMLLDSAGNRLPIL